ncbi:sensor histidine kinase [Spirillospora sp. CA-255316]
MPDLGTGLAGLRRYTWWAVPGTTAALLTLFTGDWLLDPETPLWARAAGAAALAVAVPAVVVLLGRRLARLPFHGGWLAAGAGAALVLGAVPLGFGEYGLWAVAPSMMVAITATFLGTRARLVLVAVALAVAPLPGGAAVLLSGDGGPLYAWLFPPGLVAFTVWTTLGPLWAWDTADRLNEARRLSAELAVKDERLRFAADLHDIQGHHLQVIALKSELAARLAGTDPARAAAEMEEVRRLAADALRDTRAVVQGYRRTTLDDEIANAARVLEAAGIDARMDLDPAEPGGLPASTRHLLGLVMREATTNVLRHSQARSAEIGYRVAGGVARLRVVNDGASRPDAADGGTGTGLRTLAGRLDAAAGELTWRHDGGRFLVEAALPADGGRTSEGRA